MIRIHNGDNLIYDPRNPNLKVINPVLRMEDNAAGSLTFKVYRENLNYNKIKKLYPLVSVTRDGKTIFKGRVVTDKKDFYNGKTVEVEGKLAFFNDSYLEPFEFGGAPEELFNMIIENHNSQVNAWQQFKAGTVTVKDNNDYIVRSSEQCLNTWDALKDKCFKSTLGGHIRIRYEEDGDYIDWLADCEKISSQSIEFAKNLINIESETDATETYTAIRPTGAEVEGKKIDISSVNGGIKYLVNEEKAKEYGIIFAPREESTWNDVTLPQNLLKKAKEKLFGSFVTLKETYEIKAVDLHLTDKEVEALNVCEYVPVDSKPHGISGNYFLSRIELAIAQPQNSVFYLGAVKRVLSDMNTGAAQTVEIPKNISSFKNDANYISMEETEEILSGYSNTEQVTEIVSQALESISKGEDGTDGLSAYEIACKNGFEGSEEEWLESLKGQDGKPGEDGYTPRKDIDYFDGKDGEVPVIGENENWFINGEDTGKPSRGAGENGKAATIEVGVVETVSSTESAKVENAGTENEAVFNFKIPRGEAGEGAIQCLEALGGFSFGYTEEGKPGFKEKGAESFTPFSKGGSGSGMNGSGRNLNYAVFPGEGMRFSPSAIAFADGSFKKPLSFARTTRIIRCEGTIV